MAQATIQIPYSKRSGFVALAILVIFALLLFKTCMDNYHSHDIAGAVIFGLFVAIVLALMGLLMMTRLIPALQGETALELDDDGIKDHIRGLTLKWGDVDDIGLKPGSSSAMLLFGLKSGSRAGIPLRWVAGHERMIFDTVLAYFDENQGIVREDEESEEDNY